MPAGLVRRFALAVLALFVVAGGVALTSGSASAYPATVCSVSASPHHVVSGGSVTVTGKANKSVSWTFHFGPKGGGSGTQTATGSGKTFTHVFTAPTVSSAKSYVVSGTCTGGGSQSIGISLAPQSASGSGNGSGNGSGSGTAGNGTGSGSGLPNTGGPALWMLILAVVLVGEGTRRVVRRTRTQ